MTFPDSADIKIRKGSEVAVRDRIDRRLVEIITNWLKYLSKTYVQNKNIYRTIHIFK